MKGQVIGKNMTHGYAGDYARQPYDSRHPSARRK